MLYNLWHLYCLASPSRPIALHHDAEHMLLWHLQQSLKVCCVLQASVAAALSRDVVFGRPAPATYCLASFLTVTSMCAPFLMCHRYLTGDGLLSQQGPVWIMEPISRAHNLE